MNDIEGKYLHSLYKNEIQALELGLFFPDTKHAFLK